MVLSHFNSMKQEWAETSVTLQPCSLVCWVFDNPPTHPFRFYHSRPTAKTGGLIYPTVGNSLWLLGLGKIMGWAGLPLSHHI